MQALGLPNSLCIGVDVTDTAAMKAAVQQAEAKFGPVGCMVNNAGVMLLGQADVQDPAEWQQMLNINVMGVLNGVHAVLAGMKERRSGTIINIMLTGSDGVRIIDTIEITSAPRNAATPKCSPARRRPTASSG